MKYAFFLIKNIIFAYHFNINRDKTFKMSKIIFLIFFIVAINSINAQEIDPNGYNKFYHPNGIISSEGNLKDGKPEGYWKTYYPTGIMKSEGNRRNFLLDDVWIFYDEKGDTTKKINYLYDKKNGYFYKYNSSTDSINKNYVKSKELYVDDQKQGKSYYFYPNGQIYQIILFKDNVKQGKALEYSDNGLLTSIYYYRYNNIVDWEAINRRDKEDKKNGTWKEFYKIGKIKTVINYKHGVLHGYYKEYSKAGKIIKSERYVNGELFSQTNKNNTENEQKIETKQKFYNNGNLKKSGGYIDSIPVGVHTNYSESGDILNSEIYDSLGVRLAIGLIDTNSLKQGEWTLLYPSEKKLAVGNYKNNKRVGEWTFYFEDSKVEQQGKYKNDKPEGEWNWYYETGELLRKEYYQNGLEEGEMLELTRQGDTIAKGSFSYGEKTGKWYYCVGDEVSEGEYVYDLRNGIWTHYYYPEMTLKSEGEYIQGRKHDKHKTYYRDGKIKEQGEYLNNLHHKNWRYYDKDGYIKTTINYNLGKVISIDGNKVEEDKK